MGKYVIMILVMITLPLLVKSQTDSTAYKFKLDYDVPESPAFSILDANPTSVMRGSAAKELVVQLANNFISDKSLGDGFAVDFNPYFLFYGRFKSINEYTKGTFNIKRLLSNIQVSAASISSEQFKNDNLVSFGGRITLYDAFDPLQDKKLTNDIGIALNSIRRRPVEPNDELEQYTTIEIEDLKTAYKNAKERLKNKEGFSLSLGYAYAWRSIGAKLDADSLINLRSQFWLSGQYSLKKGWNLMGLIMSRNSFIKSGDVNEILGGVGIRRIDSKFNIGGELLYSSENKQLEYGLNFELPIIKGILFTLNVGKGRSNLDLDNDRLIIKPTLKYNISE